MTKNGDSFNDKMVSSTVKPAIYLWLLACAAVVGMGIWKPDVVLQNLDGFIALIAIIGGVAAPALQTVLRMWESEQTQEVDNIPIGLKHERELKTAQDEHKIAMEKAAQLHMNEMKTSALRHSQEIEKIKLESTTEKKPITKRK
mgnify:FL=1|tara:strand:- start:344 stop:775 length:432 start_codon:yes stop_codon:yes gene_type:complete